MTTYKLPEQSTIGTILYSDGDFVWWNGDAWIPVKIGTTKLDNLSVEVDENETTENQEIAALTQQVANLQTQVTALQNTISAVQNNLMSYIYEIENSIMLLEKRD